MVRKASVALGGYFPCPEHQVANIAKLIKPYVEEDRETHKASFLDPCAGDGSAVCGLMEAIGFPRPELYTCEMETQRAKALKERLAPFWESSKRVIHGDAFRVSFRHGYSNGVSLLWLNPPYDTDKVHGRLEQKFLDRFTGTLVDNGVLLFLVPYYALSASAQTLAREYSDLHCFRFPETDFEYKQVVLCARKTTSLHNPSPAIVAQVEAWAKDAASIPGFPSEPVHELPDNFSGGLTEWVRRPVDVATLRAKIQPWVQTTRSGTRIPVLGVIPELPVQDMLLRTFPVATPPRPAHIAAGIASGLFNGARIEPDHASTGLPPLLVKGIFDREFRTVEEKYNKNGEVIGVYRVQQPKLITTILDLSTYRYHILQTGAEESGSLDVSEMTVADLLKHYGASLMAAMEKQCPVLYDPRTDGHTITLAESPRQPFTAQAHAAKALVKLLGGPSVPMKDRKGKAAILLGEIGSGKSTVALLTAVTCGATRLLVLCPPHLLDSWTHEIEAVLPDAEIRVLTDIAEVDEVTAIQGDQVVVSILSRETAKLDHGWEGVGARCPKCGSVNPPEDQAKKRSRCKHRPLLPQDREARLALRLAHKLSSSMPEHPVIADLLTGRMDVKRLKHYAAVGGTSGNHVMSFVRLYGGLTRRPTQWERLLNDVDEFTNPDLAWVDPLIVDLVAGVHGSNQWNINRGVSQTLLLLLLALNDDRRTAAVVRELLGAGNTFGVTVLHMLRSRELRAQILEESEDTRRQWDPNNKLSEELQKVADGVSFSSIKMAWSKGILGLSLPGGLACSAGSIMAAGELLRELVLLASFEYAHETCGEFLFQGVAKPRRNALARYIQKRAPQTFDFLVLDEGHEYATETSAQSRSAHRLTGLKLPTLLMTGSIMNGYAGSLFINMWSMSPSFREEFNRSEKQRYIDRYGYRKIFVQQKDESGEIIEYGLQSDRVITTEKAAGFAPGILPLFLLRHLLKISVTLHKADLALDLPKCTQRMHLIAPEVEQAKRYKELQVGLLRQIKGDMFDSYLSGKLFGQLAELPSYLDLAVVGNTVGRCEIRYPESVGGELVVGVDTFSDDVILPKEEWMLDTIEQELAEGRNCMVFCWHRSLLKRLAELIEQRIGKDVAVLHADKVSTKKRQAWITKTVVNKGVRVMVANPVTIQTGLNNLVHFCTEIWMESPACNPIVYRQAVGRVDRIGQELETRIHFPVYSGTLQGQLYDLLMRKVAVSVSTDGLDPESALQAAGVGEDDYLAGLSIGKQLWAMLQGGPEQDQTFLEALTPGNKEALRRMTDPD